MIKRALVLLVIQEVCKGVFSETGADLFGEAFKEVLVQKVETDSALSKAVSIANKSAEPKVYQRPQRSRMADSSRFLFFFSFCFRGLG